MSIYGNYYYGLHPCKQPSNLTPVGHIRCAVPYLAPVVPLGWYTLGSW